MSRARFVLVLAVGCADPTGTPVTEDVPEEEQDAAPRPTRDGAPASADRPADLVAVAPVDAAPSTMADGRDTAAELDALAAEAGGDTAASAPLTCSMFLGTTNHEWWTIGGFERLIQDEGRWQMVAVHASFVDQWANPQHSRHAELWRAAERPASRCRENGDNPDRVIFTPSYNPGSTGIEYLKLSQERWQTEIDKVIQILRRRYSRLRRIEILTFFRAPNNELCKVRPKETRVPPQLDAAIEALVARYPALVFSTPRFEVASCSQFTSDPPHLTADGARYVAKLLADHYNAP